MVPRYATFNTMADNYLSTVGSKLLINHVPQHIQNTQNEKQNVITRKHRFT